MNTHWKATCTGSETVDELIPIAQDSVMEPYFDAMIKRGVLLSEVVVVFRNFGKKIEIEKEFEAGGQYEEIMKDASTALKLNAATLFEARCFEGRDLSDLSKTDHFSSHMNDVQKVIPKASISNCYG